MLSIVTYGAVTQETKWGNITVKQPNVPTSHPYSLRTPINKGIVRGVTWGERSHPMSHPTSHPQRHRATKWYL